MNNLIDLAGQTGTVQNEILNKLEELNYNIAQQDKIINKADPIFYSLLVEEGIKSEETEQNTYFMAIYKEVTEEWSNFEESINKFHSLQMEGTFLSPEEHLACFTFDDSKERDQWDKIVHLTFKHWHRININTLNDTDCAPSPKYTAWIPSLIPEKPIYDTGVTIRSVRVARENQGTVITFFTKDHYKDFLDIQVIEYNDTTHEIRASYQSNTGPVYKLWLGGMSPNTKISQIKRYLNFFKLEYTDINIIREKKTKRSIGCAFITFPHAKALIQAKSTKLAIENRILKWATPRQGKKYKSETI